jgi:hypothetical protein
MDRSTRARRAGVQRSAAWLAAWAGALGPTLIPIAALANTRPDQPGYPARNASGVAPLPNTVLAAAISPLGIDGGRSYSGSFADLAQTTRLANGQPLFDLQFARVRINLGLRHHPMSVVRAQPSFHPPVPVLFPDIGHPQHRDGPRSVLLDDALRVTRSGDRNGWTR